MQGEAQVGGGVAFNAGLYLGGVGGADCVIINVCVCVSKALI